MDLAPLIAPKTFEEQLAWKVWITRGARFGAHRRLTRMHEWSNRAIAILSVYLLIASIAIATSDLVPIGYVRGVSFIITAGSLLVLILSLLESSRNYAVRAERLHNCGVRLGRLELEVARAREIPDPDAKLDRISQLASSYDQILESCGVNHDQIDVAWFRADHPNDFKLKPVMAWRVRILCWLRSFGLFLAMIVAPPLVAALWMLRWSQS